MLCHWHSFLPLWKGMGKQKGNWWFLLLQSFLELRVMEVEAQKRFWLLHHSFVTTVW
jgi:hypothetical protein